jgi:quinolinate synthase
MAGLGDLPAERTHVLSTGGMLDQARTTTARRVLVATEVGMLNQLRQVNSSTVFEPVNPRATCAYMKMTTPTALLAALRHGVHEIHVDAEVGAQARRAVEAMLAYGTPSATAE